MTLKLTPRLFDEAKRLIGQSAPHIKSSHRAEALARGLGFATNAALQSKISMGSAVECIPSRIPFEEFLRERGYEIDKLQISLLNDALWLASERKFDLGDQVSQGAIRGFGPWESRWCMTCGSKFLPFGFSNRICGSCRARPGRMPSVEFPARVMLAVVDFGDLERLRRRPGWSDYLQVAAGLDDATALARLRNAASS